MLRSRLQLSCCKRPASNGDVSCRQLVGCHCGSISRTFRCSPSQRCSLAAPGPARILVNSISWCNRGHRSRLDLPAPVAPSRRSRLKARPQRRGDGQLEASAGACSHFTAGPRIAHCHSYKVQLDTANHDVGQRSPCRVLRTRASVATGSHRFNTAAHLQALLRHQHRYSGWVFGGLGEGQPSDSWLSA